jgi:methionine synthase II (cobalamin-independent)
MVRALGRTERALMLSSVGLAFAPHRYRGAVRRGRSAGLSRRGTKLSSVPDTAAANEFPWPPATATGVGSMPGTDMAEAIAVITGELPDLPHLPELPDRGPGADLIGRTAALLVDMPVETTPGGWKFTSRAGRDQRRAADLMAGDLDALQDAADRFGGAVKIQLCGPWTLAATIELSRSQDPALADPGAVADLTESLAEGVAAHVEQIRGRLPGATVLLQLDEPALPAVLAGSVPTASGLNRIPEIDTTVASAGLRSVLSATTAFGLLHCCAEDFPFGIMKDAGVAAVSFDVSLLRRRAEDAFAEAAEAGMGLLLGVLPTTAPKRDSPASMPPPRQTASQVTGIWHRIGLATARLAEQVVITPACGLAGTSPADARAALAHCREAARIIPEMIEEGAR